MTEYGIDRSLDDLRAGLAQTAAFIRRMLRFWRVPASILIGGTVACGLLLSLRTPVYRSKTVIFYSEGVRGTGRLKELLLSYIALDTVGREFDLYSGVRRRLGPVSAAEELRRHVEFRAPGGDTFSIAFTGASPEQAKQVTRRLAELLIGRHSELRRERAIAARDFLEAEERATTTELRSREKELAAFIAAHPRFAFDATPSSMGAAIRASRQATPAGLMGVRTSAAVGTARAGPAQALVTLETDWVRLIRGVDQARRHHELLEGAVYEANLSARSEATGHGIPMTVIDPAFTPRTAVPPSRTAIVALVLAVSIAFGILAAAIRTALDDRVYEARDIAALSLVLARIPRAS